MTTSLAEPTSSPASTPTPAAPSAAGGFASDPRRLGYVLGAIVAAVAVAWFFIEANKRKARFAAEALDRARATAEAGNIPLASSELQRVIDTYKGTSAAAEAVLSLNEVRLANQQTELAATGLRDAIDRGVFDADLLPGAYGLLGVALENTGRFAEAAEAYGKASAAAAAPFLKAERLMDQGRALALAGRRDDAAAAYRTVLERFGTTDSKIEAQVRLAELTQGRM